MVDKMPKILIESVGVNTFRTGIQVFPGLESASAKDEQLSEFDWYEYNGRQKKTVTHRSHVRDITPGMIYGLRPIRGGDYYLILPDMYHVDFRIAKREADSMIKRSKAKRGVPKIASLRTGRQRAQRAPTKIDTGSDRFRPLKKITKEGKKNGIDLGNYQWRKLTEPRFAYQKTQKIGFEMKRGQMFGCRFVNANKGGVIVLRDGTRFVLPTVNFDDLMEMSFVLPLNKWLSNVITPSDISETQAEQEAAKERQLKKQNQERARLKQELRLKKKQEEAKIKKKAREDREKARQRQQDLINKSPKAPVSYSPVVRKDGLDALVDSIKQEDDELIDGINDIADANPELDLDDLEVDEIDKNDLEVDENEVEVADVDQDAVEEALDKEINEATEEARSMQIVDDDEDETDFDDLDEEDRIDIEEDDDDIEVEEDDPDLEEQNAEAEQEEALDSADADDEYEDIDENDEELDDADQEGDEDSDDTDGDSEESQDEDQEEPQEEEPFEEGDVIVFKEDATDKREFVILDIYPLKKNDKITVFKLYDFEADEQEFRTVRVKTENKNSIMKMANKIRKMNPKEFAKYFNAMEGYEKNPEPITS